MLLEHMLPGKLTHILWSPGGDTPSGLPHVRLGFKILGDIPPTITYTHLEFWIFFDTKHPNKKNLDLTTRYLSAVGLPLDNPEQLGAFDPDLANVVTLHIRMVPSAGHKGIYPKIVRILPLNSTP